MFINSKNTAPRNSDSTYGGATIEFTSGARVLDTGK